MKRFSKQYKTFKSWKQGRKLTVYSQLIIRKHEFNPKARLEELQITPIFEFSLAGKPWKNLSVQEKEDRPKALSVLRALRDGKSFTNAMREAEISKNGVKKHLGKFLIKKNGRLTARLFDSIERRMHFYKNGKILSIIITNSRDASLIGEYFSAVNQALEHNNIASLRKFERISITDADGVTHKFETNLERLLEIEEIKEDSEGFEPYDDET